MDWFKDIGSALGGWIALAVMAGGLVYQYFHQQFATNKAVENAKEEFDEENAALKDEVRDKFAELDVEVAYLKNGLKNTPTRKEYSEMQRDMAELNGRLDVNLAEMKHLSDTLSRVERPLAAMIENAMAQTPKGGAS